MLLNLLNREIMTNYLITVATYENVNQANRLKQWLDNEGIECTILDRGLIAGNVASSVGQYELKVFEADAARSLEILGEAEKQEKTFSYSNDIEMEGINHIIVPIDFSSNSLNAAYYAAHVANQKDADLTFVHVYFNPVTNPVSYDHFYSFPANVAETLNEIVQHANEMVKQFIANFELYLSIHKLTKIRYKSELVGGIAEEAILNIIDNAQYQLMIIGARGKENPDNWFGTFMTEVISNAKIPVLVIPADVSYKKTMFKRLMYATNFDKSDGLAIRKLIAIAKPLDTQISIVHIDDTRNNPFINYDLAHFKDRYVGEVGDVKMDFDLIVNKNLSDGIEDYIQNNKIDILAVTSHKRSIFTSLFVPSLTRHLLFRLNIPMLIFHP